MKNCKLEIILYNITFVLNPAMWTFFPVQYCWLHLKKRFVCKSNTNGRLLKANYLRTQQPQVGVLNQVSI